MTYGFGMGVPATPDPTYSVSGEIYIPVYAAGDQERKLSKLVLVTEDPELRRIASEARNMENLDEKALEAWAAKHIDELYLKRDIVGAIQSEFELSGVTRNELGDASEGRLAPNFVVIRDGAKPSALGSIATTLGGVLIGFISLVFWVLTLVHRSNRNR